MANKAFKRGRDKQEGILRARMFTHEFQQAMYVVTKYRTICTDYRGVLSAKKRQIYKCCDLFLVCTLSQAGHEYNTKQLITGGKPLKETMTVNLRNTSPHD